MFYYMVCSQRLVAEPLRNLHGTSSEPPRNLSEPVRNLLETSSEPAPNLLGTSSEPARNLLRTSSDPPGTSHHTSLLLHSRKLNGMQNPSASSEGKFRGGSEKVPRRGPRRFRGGDEGGSEVSRRFRRRFRGGSEEVPAGLSHVF